MEIWTGQTQSAEEDHAIQLKAPEQLLNERGGEIILSTAVSKVKNEVSILTLNLTWTINVVKVLK